MKRLIVIATLAALPALAQQRPSDEEINARIQTLTAQRNAAQDQAVLLSGQATAEIGKLQAEVERLKKLCGEACKPKAEEPKK